MNKINFLVPKRLLSYLPNRIDDYYLAGGTALSLFYFQHRQSFDLDFFTKDFSKDGILKIMQGIEKDLKVTTKLHSEQLQDRFVKMIRYLVIFQDKNQCIIDFVEDCNVLINEPRCVDGIKILSLDDIYLRKVFTIAGHIKSQDIAGRDILIGGRQEAKDFYDLYCLSSTSTPLCEFVSQYCDATLKEGVIRWFQTYDRMSIKTGLLDLVTDRDLDYRIIEGHFKEEIDRLLAKVIEGE